ncbi:MAG TPA: TolC family protein [Kofleriaceae bacterium]|nr:TolC family protein [Kofleriaceae bacterium]
MARAAAIAAALVPLVLIARGDAAAQTRGAAKRLTLAELTRRAVGGPRADAARFVTRQAEAQVAEATGARFPRLDVRALAAPSPSIDCDDPACTTTSPQDATLALDGLYGGVELTLAQPLYTFGKLSAARDGARSAAAAARSGEASVAGDIQVDAARAYYGLKLARELRFELEDGLADIEKARKQLAEQLDKGGESATVQDRLRLDTVLAEARSRLAEAREAEDTALAAVRVLARDPSIDIDDAALEPVDAELGASEAYGERAVGTRPELIALRHLRSGAQSLADLEWSRFFPDLLLVGTFNLARAQGVDDPPSAFARDPFNTTSFGVAAALRWTFEPMSQRGRLLRARAKRDEVAAQVSAASEAVRVDVARAHAQARSARARLEAARDGEKSARGWVASVVQAEAIGAVEAKDLADAYLAYFTLRARYLQGVHDWNVALVRLGRAVGRGAVVKPRARPAEARPDRPQSTKAR